MDINFNYKLENGVLLLFNEEHKYNVEDIMGMEPNYIVGEWDTSKVTDMSYMFSNSKFNKDISKWDVSNVTNMSGMFYSSHFNQDISKWDVSKVTDMIGMFYKSSFNRDISKWDVSNVTNMSGMFYNSKFNQDISKWDVSEVTNMSYVFTGCEHIHSIDNCGNENRTIYLNHIDPSLVHIGCFTGTKEEAVDAIRKKYGDDEKGMDYYINQVEELFNMVNN